MIADVSATQWLIGWIVAGVLIVVVAALLIAITGLAASVKGRLLAIRSALVKARDNSGALWDVRTTKLTLSEILNQAKKARGRLSGE